MKVEWTSAVAGGSFGWVRVTDVAESRPLGLHGVCRAALPFEGLEDARPGVAPAPVFAGPAAFQSAIVRR
jgi:hypothetical protein